MSDTFADGQVWTTENYQLSNQRRRPIAFGKINNKYTMN